MRSLPLLDMQSEQSQSQAGMQCLSLILLTTRKQSFTRTQVHSIISQKSILRNAKPQCREGTDISVSCPGSNSTLIERLLYSRHCVWDTEQIWQGFLSHSSGLMSNPKAANERLLGCILPLAFCLVPTVLNIFLFIINCQLLASLKWATSTGFQNIKSQPHLPLIQDKGPLEMTSVPTFSYCLSPRQLWPNSPTSTEANKYPNKIISDSIK